MKKFNTKICGMIALIVVVIGGGVWLCSSQSASPVREKTVSTEKVEAVQGKAEEPTAELLSVKDSGEKNNADTGTKLRPPVMPETVQKPEINMNFDFEAIYADLRENHPDTASAMGAAILSIPGIFDNESAADLFEEYLSKTGHDIAAAPGLVEYLLKQQSSDSTSTTTTTTASSQPSTNTSSGSSTGEVDLSGGFTYEEYVQMVKNGQKAGLDMGEMVTREEFEESQKNMIHGDPTVDASNSYVDEWTSGEFVFGPNGTIQVISSDSNEEDHAADRPSTWT
ncbi:hypothetical protein ACTQ33_01845 [Candidatus Avoscillospira sp. LCP25S3_F1]|uniref:hypothetical protein n=1 Tax=Candidatus Avoscillospira sp. LCP25S3_F1 TaxID=3438825 RepID=UPI003F91FFF4